MSEEKFTQGTWVYGWNGGLTGPRTPTTQGPTCGCRWDTPAYQRNWFPVSVGTDCVAIAVGADNAEAKANARIITEAPAMYRELSHLVSLLEPLERGGSLNVPGLATLNNARAIVARVKGGV